MWPERVSNPGPLTYESGALPTALRGPALGMERAGKEQTRWIIYIALANWDNLHSAGFQNLIQE